MKHFVCVAVVLLVFVGYIQAAEVSFIELKGHTGVVNFAAFSLDGTKIVTASADKTARIWDAETGKELHKLEGHADNCISVAFSPDGKKVVTGSLDKTVRIWDAETGKELQKSEGEQGAYRVVFSSDGKKIAVDRGDDGGGIQILDTDSGKELKMLLWPGAAPLNIIAFSADGNEVIVNWGDGQNLRFWHIESGQGISKNLQNIFAGSLYNIDNRFFFDGTKIAAVVTVDRDNVARIWDVESGSVLQKLEGRVENRSGMSNARFFAIFSPDGKKIFIWDGSWHGWDVASGKELQNFPRVMPLVFSPDSKRMMTTTINNNYPARIWTLE